MKQVAWNIAIAVDQLFNAMIGGKPDETISSRLGKWKRDKLSAGTWAPVYYDPRYLLDAFLEAIDPHHSLDAIEDDE